MSGFLMWKYISFDDITRLESSVDESQLRMYRHISFFYFLFFITKASFRLLHEIFQLSSMEQKKQKIAVNFHLYNYA